MKHLPLIFFVFLILVPRQGKAIGPFHLEAFGSGALGKTVLGSESESPTMTSYSLGATVGFKVFAGVYLGVSYTQEIVNQLTDSNAATFGNRTGKYGGVSPTLGWHFLLLHLKYQHILSGDYELDNKTAAGQTISYTEASGMRLTAQISLLPLIKLGPFYQKITFDKSKVNSTETSITAAPFEYTSYGLALSIIL